MKLLKRILFINLLFIIFIVKGSEADTLYWVNKQSGTVHNKNCRYYFIKNGEHKSLNELTSTNKNCRICKGREYVLEKKEVGLNITKIPIKIGLTIPQEECSRLQIIINNKLSNECSKQYLKYNISIKEIDEKERDNIIETEDYDILDGGFFQFLNYNKIHNDRAGVILHARYHTSKNMEAMLYISGIIVANRRAKINFKKLKDYTLYARRKNSSSGYQLQKTFLENKYHIDLSEKDFIFNLKGYDLFKKVEDNTKNLIFIGSYEKNLLDLTKTKVVLETNKTPGFILFGDIHHIDKEVINIIKTTILKVYSQKSIKGYDYVDKKFDNYKTEFDINYVKKDSVKELGYFSVFIIIVISLIISVVYGYYKSEEYKKLKKLKEKEEREKELANARVAERDKILRSLSHKIKNLITRIDAPLRSLADEKGKNKMVKDAMKGTQLIREIIHGFNYSYTGSVDDFIYDAHNIKETSLTFSEVIISAILPSLENMFDGKWFKDYLDRYFENKDIFMDAKSKWQNLDETSLKAIEELCQEYFFKSNISVSNLDDIKIGDSKGSRLKFLILFQEVIFNAVKYSSFVKKEDRFLNISLCKTESGIEFFVENSYMTNIMEKGTGLGQVIVETMSNLMQAKYEVSKKGNTYSVKIDIPNYWKKDSANNADKIIETN